MILSYEILLTLGCYANVSVAVPQTFIIQAASFLPRQTVWAYFTIKNKQNEQTLYLRRSHKCLVIKSCNKNAKVINNWILDRSTMFTEILVHRVVRSSKYRIDIVVTWNQIRNQWFIIFVLFYQLLNKAFTNLCLHNFLSLLSIVEYADSSTD